MPGGPSSKRLQREALSALSLCSILMSTHLRLGALSPQLDKKPLANLTGSAYPNITTGKERAGAGGRGHCAPA
jgi:hypothetical protein